MERSWNLRQATKIKEDWHLRVSAPGRIHLIGEHIDYNGGCVLTPAIDL